MTEFERPRRRRRVRSGETAELNAIRAVAPRFEEIQVTFARGEHEKACIMLMSLSFSFGISDRPSTHLRMVEAAQVIRRVRNDFGFDWHRTDAGYRDLVNLKAYALFDDVLLAIFLDALGYAYRDIYRVPPSAGDSWTSAGEFWPGYDETDAQIRFRRLQALAREYAADQNMSREETKALLSRCFPMIDRDDPRFWKFSCEQ